MGFVEYFNQISHKQGKELLDFFPNILFFNNKTDQNLNIFKIYFKIQY